VHPQNWPLAFRPLRAVRNCHRAARTLDMLVPSVIALSQQGAYGRHSRPRRRRGWPQAYDRLEVPLARSSPQGWHRSATLPVARASAQPSESLEMRCRFIPLGCSWPGIPLAQSARWLEWPSAPRPIGRPASKALSTQRRAAVQNACRHPAPQNRWSVPPVVLGRNARPHHGHDAVMAGPPAVGRQVRHPCSR
jgi:hypothetical protein